MAKKQPKIEEIGRAHIVNEHAKLSVKNFFKAFDTVKETRKSKGPPTDEEQDLLRAALVFAGAGLDSSVKELIRGSLRTLAKQDTNVQKEFETFVQRQLRGDSSEDGNGSSHHKFLASVLLSPSPQERLLNDYIRYLTGSSLQSVDQLFKAVKALGIDLPILQENKPKLAEIFDVRNKIIHELDVRFSGMQGKRHRNSRKRPELQDFSDLLLKVAEALVTAVESKLKETANTAISSTRSA